MLIRELFKHWTYQVFAPGTLLRKKYNAFKNLLKYDGICLELIADLEEIFYQDQYADWARIEWFCRRLEAGARMLIENLMLMSPTKYLELPEYLQKINFYIRMGCSLPAPAFDPPYTIGLHMAAQHPELSGGKAAHLSRIMNETDIPVAPGFVVTTNAFNYFVESNGLRPELDRILRRIRPCKTDRMNEWSTKLQNLIKSAELPTIIGDEIKHKASVLAHGGELLSVRSSALAEDGKASFAGQYESLLNVSAETVLDAYTSVLASKYLPKALNYRILNGLADQETPMAVLIQPMQSAAASGLVYTKDPQQPEEGNHLIFAVPGLGDSLMDGQTQGLCFTKGNWSAPDSGEKDDAQEKKLKKIMEPALLETIGRYGMELEKIFASPQDVEWTLNERKEVTILQSRPLKTEAADHNEADRLRPDAEKHLLFRGGEKVGGGLGSGITVHLQDPEKIDGDEIPKNTILVTGNLAPSLARYIHNLNGVLASTGSRASHFSSIAREFGVPVLVNIDAVFDRFAPGRILTIDAKTLSVYSGNQLIDSRPREEMEKPDTPVMQRLAKIIPHVAKLSLTDPQAPEFSPSGCKSIHDVVRFAHEKGVSEMFSLVGKGGRGLGKARRLITHLPISMYILDLDQGLFDLSHHTDKNTVTPEDFRSLPMWALWWGLQSEDVQWDENLHHVDWEEFDRVSAGIFSKNSPLLSSYAVISNNYMHLMLRFGYHFSVVDSLCDKDEKNNYINFKFKGGGASFDNRLLRLEFIRQVLSRAGFSVRSKGDLLDARLSRKSETLIQQRLALLGRLLAETRLMDMRLNTNEDVDQAVDAFMQAFAETSTGDESGR